MKFLIKISAIITSIVSPLFIAYSLYFAPVDKESVPQVFIIPQDQTGFNLPNSLNQSKLIKNEKAFSLLFDNFSKRLDVKSGGYNLSGSMNSWEIIKTINNNPDLLWVNILYCPRKEQVGEKLANTLGWNKEKLNEWNKLFINTDYFEGVYYPDTYLIPVNETVEEVAQRFIQNFEDKFAPLENEYLNKNIKWTTGLKIASLIAREAAGKEDASLISGIIWNRLNQKMRLQIDATMQYTLGKNESGSWWGNISLEEKQSDSPYNSYKHEGLPPTPICSPNIDYIEAALNPEETDCIFYLHDSTKQIHCAKTYFEHLENIKLYLQT
jgi:UPF0755 protein